LPLPLTRDLLLLRPWFNLAKNNNFFTVFIFTGERRARTRQKTQKIGKRSTRKIGTSKNRGTAQTNIRFNNSKQTRNKSKETRQNIAFAPDD